ncbi:TPA: hypothetical protein U1B13_001592 [Streptococcus suis]|uniref:hypothetical protein n=1 Tax=Streptococcus suis TaxID=1307 RepID=UPI001E4567D4|nr:hypothetical protein [Streptococcus suis]MCB2869754.1 hypothetical protein [Streptococcus suis]HEM3505619.1 hypothetical protein [Streptococcus suis]
MAEINSILFPKKLGDSPMDSKKLMDLVYNYAMVEEIIEKIVEEKVRSIFYGNPTAIFLKDPCKFELKNYFKDNYEKELGFFSKIIAYRNIIIHNDSRVDSKFLKECKYSDFILNQKITISTNYLIASIALLVGLAGEITTIYLREVHKFEPRKTTNLYRSTRKFRKLSKSEYLINNII